MIDIQKLLRLDMDLAVKRATMRGIFDEYRRFREDLSVMRIEDEYRKLREDELPARTDARKGEIELLARHVAALKTRIDEISAECAPLAQLVANLRAYAKTRGISA